MAFSSGMVAFLCMTALTAISSRVVLEGHLELAGYNFAFLESFCGNASGPVVQYSFSYPQEYCCYKLFSYFQDQWWKIWPRPELDCHEKTNVLEEHESQVVKLTTNSSRAGCREVASNNGTNILCQGSQMYRVQTEDFSTKKCWFLAVSNCNSTTKGIQVEYYLNITGAIASTANKHLHGDLPSRLLFWLIITLFSFGPN